MHLERREMKKKDKKEAEFLLYQKLAYKKMQDLINDGWDNFNFDMPPEFVLPYTLYNLVMTSDKLSDEAKEHWANGQKHFWKKEKTNVKRFISKTTKKPVLH